MYRNTNSEGIDKLQEPNQGKNNSGSNQILLRKALDETILSLGGPIHKTITWHMNNRGVFSEAAKIDISAFYSNLKELVGPGADMIMEEAWQKLKKRYKGSSDLGSGNPIDRMIRMFGSEESA